MDAVQNTYSPVDNTLYITRPYASSIEINQAIELANTVQGDWQKISLSQKKQFCLNMLNALENNQDEIALELTMMMGRPIRYAKNEIATMIDRAKYMIDIAEQGLSPITISTGPNIKRYIKREPLGVVFIIAPWNYPYLTTINTLIPALLAGNSVILKHSSQTPLCAEQFAAAFEKSQLPTGVFQFLHLTHKDTESILNKHNIDFVAFTGSVKGGKSIEKAISGRFMASGLELGGKDPAYIRADADLEHAVATCIDGAFFNSGQSCCAIERIYVHEKVYETFVSLSINMLKHYKLGLPTNGETTLGPVVKESAADHIINQIDDAIQKGAVKHITPDVFSVTNLGRQYLSPQLLTQVNHSMQIMTEESFGPVVGIMKVSSDEQAIELMNDSQYGLTASVFTKDLDSAISIGEKVATGTFFVNRCDYLDPELAWTGVKNSGRGITLSSLGYEQLTRAKSFYIKSQD